MQEKTLKKQMFKLEKKLQKLILDDQIMKKIKSGFEEDQLITKFLIWYGPIVLN